jgi:hypothetical protein
VFAYLKKYVVLTELQTILLSLWVVHTHAIDAADATPYIHVTSPEPECGKTRLLEILVAIVARPWMTAYTTKATLVRKVDRQQPTLLLDELDAALKTDQEYVEGVRGVLNSGYLRSGVYSMCVGQGANLTDRDFRTFGPKILAGIGTLPRSVASRSIPIALKRRAKNEPVARWREREGRAEAAPIHDALTAWAPPAINRLRVARPEFPGGLRDRAEDVLEPLVAIADLAGDTWPERARTAALALLGSEKADDDSIGVQLLTDLRQVFAAHNDPSALSSKQIRDDLAALEDRQWATWGKAEKPITGHALARQLRAFGVVSAGDMRIGEKVTKGYRREAFTEAWSRYLPSEVLQRNNPNKSGPETAISEGLHAGDVADRKTQVSLRETGLCCDVALQKPDLRAEGQEVPDDAGLF